MQGIFMSKHGGNMDDIRVEVYNKGGATWVVWIHDMQGICHTLKGTDFEWVNNIVTQLNF